jgi:hypothetical protein
MGSIARLQPKKNYPGDPTWFDALLQFRYIIKVPTHHCLTEHAAFSV